MNNYGTWLTLISFVIIPLTLLAVAIIFIGKTESLLEKLPEHSLIKKWLNNPGNWRDPLWLRNRIDMVFSLLLAAVFILITIIYS